MSTLHVPSLAWLALASTLTGCLETTSCPQSMPNRVGGRCVPDELVDAGRDSHVEVPDAGPCGACSVDRPHCDEDTETCVACLEDVHCPLATAPHCAAGTCGACTNEAQCAGRTGAPECDPTSGACVACTPAAEAVLCGDNSCDTATGACTETMRGSIGACMACVADSECAPDHRCIAMRFAGLPHGAYCLKRFSTGCSPPYGNRLEDRESLSSAAPDDYCGIDEAETTCEAVVAFSDACPTGLDTECASEGAVCGSVVGIANRCTYPCDDSLQCPSERPCPTGGGYCGGT
jgi:hypothetical protein